MFFFKIFVIVSQAFLYLLIIFDYGFKLLHCINVYLTSKCSRMHTNIYLESVAKIKHTNIVTIQYIKL